MLLLIIKKLRRVQLFLASPPLLCVEDEYCAEESTLIVMLVNLLDGYLRQEIMFSWMVLASRAC